MSSLLVVLTVLLAVGTVESVVGGWSAVLRSSRLLQDIAVKDKTLMAKKDFLKYFFIFPPRVSA